MKNWSIRYKLLFILLFVGLVPFMGISTLEFALSKQTLKESYQEKLVSVRDTKKNNIEMYFQGLSNQLIISASNPAVIRSMEEFDRAFSAFPIALSSQALIRLENYYKTDFANTYAQATSKSIDTLSLIESLDSPAKAFQSAFISENPAALGSKNDLIQLSGALANSDYADVHSRFHPWFNELLNLFELYDVFLVNNQGRMVYSVFKELDFATDLNTGLYSQTGLGQAWRQAVKLKAGEVAYIDLAPYTPSYEAPAGFIATPVFRGNQQRGVLIFQMPLDTITTVMSNRAGLGQTGESYLIGPDQLMRSDSYLSPETHSVAASFANPEAGKVVTDAANRVLKGETGVQLINDYNGNPVLSAYAPIQFGSFNWGMIVEQDVAEVFASTQALMIKVLIIGLFMAVLIAAFAIWVGNVFSRPIIQLVNNMREVGRSFNFKQRIHVHAKDEVGQASASFNQMMASLSQAIDDVNKAVNAVAQGDFSQKVDSEMTGDLLVLKLGINQSAENIEKVTGQILFAMDSLAKGEFDVQVETNAAGRYQVILQQSNHALTHLNAIVSDINESMTQMREGRFNSRVSAEALGTLNEMKQNFNQSMEAISTAISEISQVVAAQAGGDLTVKLPKGTFKGELHDLKNAINYSSLKMNEVVNVAIDVSDVVNNAAKEVSQGAGDLSQRVQEQAAALEQTSATMEQMTSQLKSTAENAHRASELASNVTEKASHGVSIMSDTIDAMATIEESSSRIVEIVTLIDGIAFQTNLLALNAAVEAARAGEHGRGFAVVAGEVRALAQKSAEAAKEIKLLIDETSLRVNNGSVLANQTGETLNVIQAAIGQVSDMIKDMARATEEQTEGVSQVNQAISQIDGVTQQNAALVEETSAAAESLSEQSRALQKEMSFFKTDAHPTFDHASEPSKYQSKFDKSKSDVSSLKSNLKQPRIMSPVKVVKANDEWAEF